MRPETRVITCLAAIACLAVMLGAAAFCFLKMHDLTPLEGFGALLASLVAMAVLWGVVL